MRLRQFPQETRSTNEAAIIVDDLAEQLARRWKAGDMVPVEEFLADYPDVMGQPAAALELLAEELTLREECGQPAHEADLRRRFPQWENQVRILLDCQKMLATSAAPTRFPVVGEEIGDFRLSRELGRGSNGRVFLATQPCLADRPIVLKLAPDTNGEHLSLARLQHTHIVPLYSVHEFPGHGLRGLCMPYFGGTTLADAQQAMCGRHVGRRTGRDLWAVVPRGRIGSATTVAGPAGRFLEESSYCQTVCWIGAYIADALAYAHERGLLHLDLKSSNVLLAADGQPMLLDFHLARGPLAAGEDAPAWLGGTPEYMAPEHAAALAAVRSCSPVPAAVDGRADVYALGLILVEALSGRTGADRFPTRVWRRANSHVSVALADLLAKCLAADPADRYPAAAALAMDLRRHLADLPLRGVANRSLLERWGKWRRRRPLALPLTGLLVLAGVTGAGALAHLGRQADQARLALGLGIECLQGRRYGEALESLKAGSALADGLPFHGELAAQLRLYRRRADLGLMAGELHALCEGVRPLYGATTLPERSARVIESCCRDVWERRSLMMRDIEQSVDLDRRVRADLLDLAILWADLHTRLAAPAVAPAARQTALNTLTEAEQLFGSSCVLAQEKRLLATELGLTALAGESARQAEILSPSTAWEHYALGRAFLRAGDVTAAAQEMDRAVAMRPQDLWPNYYRGSCAFRAGQYEDAITAFSVCVALAPDSAWCYFNRGLALAEHGRPDTAQADFDRAVSLDPGLAIAALSRGTLHLKAGRSAEALKDFQLALDLGADAATTQYQLAVAHLAAQNTTAARASLHHALDCDPDYQPARDLLARIGPADR